MSNSNKVLIIGDPIIDVNHYCKRRGLSAETPTFVAEHVESCRTLGGSALVCRNISALGGEPRMLYISEKQLSIPCDPIELRLIFDQIYAKGWSVTKKERFFVENYKLFQVDSLNKGRYNTKLEDFVYDSICSKIRANDFRVIYIADNRHGTFDSRAVMQAVYDSIGSDTKIIVDSQVSQNESNHYKYRPDIFLMNDVEFESFCQREVRSNDFKSFRSTGSKNNFIDRLKRACNISESDIIVKRGGDGSIACINNKIYENEAESHPMLVKDTCGAGDAFGAVIALGYIGEDEEKVNETLHLAHLWAGMSVEEYGTTPPEKDNEIISRLSELRRD